MGSWAYPPTKLMPALQKTDCCRAVLPSGAAKTTFLNSHHASLGLARCIAAPGVLLTLRSNLPAKRLSRSLLTGSPSLEAVVSETGHWAWKMEKPTLLLIFPRDGTGPDDLHLLMKMNSQ